MRHLLSPLLLSAGLIVGGAALQSPASAAPLPVTGPKALAGESLVDQVHYRRHRHYRRHVHYGRRIYRPRRVYARRYYDPGAAVAGAALGLFGTALVAATAPRVYYYPSYSYYPAYYGGWGYPYGYRTAYWGGYPSWGYRRAYWGGGYGYRRAYWGGGYGYRGHWRRWR